jgi:hypothetical protein
MPPCRPAGHEPGSSVLLPFVEDQFDITSNSATPAAVWPEKLSEHLRDLVGSVIVTLPVNSSCLGLCFRAEMPDAEFVSGALVG